jgi:hypothetical protein
MHWTLLTPLLVFATGSDVPRKPAAAAPMALPAGPIAVMATDQCDPAERVTETSAFRKALAAQPGVEAMSEAATLAPMGGATVGTLAEGEALLKSGQQAYLQGRIESSEVLTQHALAILTTQAPSGERWGAEREALTVLALIDDRSGRSAEAMERMRRILILDVGFHAQASVCPPDFIQRVEAVRKEVDGVEKSLLTVNTVPSGLPIYINDVGSGTSPLQVKLPPGDYEVDIRWASRRGLPRRVHLDGPANLFMDTSLEGSVYPDSGPCVVSDGSAENRTALLAELGHVLKASSIIGIREEEQPGAGKRMVALAVEVAKGHSVREGAIAADGTPPPQAMAKLAAFLATGAPQDGVTDLLNVRVVERPIESPKDDAASRKMTQIMTTTVPPREDYPMRFLSYGVTALATAGLVTGIVYYLKADLADDEISSLYNPIHNTFPAGSESLYDHFASEENTNRTLAVGLWIGTGVLAVVAVVLYIKSGGGSQEAFRADLASRRGTGLAVHF